MGKIAKDMIKGKCCERCGVYFERQHGYSVVCNDCFKHLSKPEKLIYQLAKHKKL